MKKKNIFILIVLSMIIVITVAFIIYFLGKQEKQKLIQKTKLEYEFFMKSEILKDPKDVTKKLFNDVNIEQSKNQKINEKEFVKNLFQETSLDIENHTKLKNMILDEMKQYDIEALYHLQKAEGSIKDEKLDVETLKKMYEEHDFIKQLDDEVKKRQMYIQSLESLQLEVQTIVEKQKNYYIKNGEYVCQSDEVMNLLNEFKQKYELDFKIVKEPENLEPVPILYYHGVLDEPWGIHALFVRVNEFDKQMNYLKEAGYTPIFISEIKQAHKYEKPIVITFDDGYRDLYTNAFPILKKYHFKANVYVITNSMGWDAYLTQDMIKEMSDSSLVEIGSHTVSHKELAKLTKEEIEYEVRESQKTLESLLGKKVESIVYPSGSFDSRVIEISKKYYQYGISIIPGKEIPNRLNTYSMRRISVYRNKTLEQFKKSF